jgi:tetratricopeptide (TPR) repeat protein
LNFRSNEKYATKKISKINEILNYRETQEEAYKSSIAKADKLFTEQQYTGSRAEYEKAHEIKPMEQYPNVRIDEIDVILAKIKNKKEIYDHTIAGADKLYNTGDYEVAMVQYQKALEIFPGKQYPKDRISEINAILNEITRQQAINKNYNKAITNADQFFNESDYEKAKEAYEAALTLKPNESYPKRKISESTVFILSAMEAKKKEYRKAIADADKYFNQNIYDNAIDKYMTAHDILPNELYPVDMVSRIKKIINDNAIVDINRENILIQENTERRFDFNPMPVSVRKANYILIKARNPVDKKFKILVNFGKDNSKNGGVAIKIPESKDINDYIIRISAQYKWFSEDNNWISIYPEGGELEVSLIRISKSN